MPDKNSGSLALGVGLLSLLSVYCFGQGVFHLFVGSWDSERVPAWYLWVHASCGLINIPCILFGLTRQKRWGLYGVSATGLVLLVTVIGFEVESYAGFMLGLPGLLALFGGPAWLLARGRAWVAAKTSEKSALRVAICFLLIEGALLAASIVLGIVSPRMIRAVTISILVLSFLLVITIVNVLDLMRQRGRSRNESSSAP